MINDCTKRDKYILKPTVPAGTTEISYTVSIAGNLVFMGKTKYFGGDYEVDCSDWIDSYIASYSQIGHIGIITYVNVYVVFTYSGGTTETMELKWQEKSIYLDEIVLPQSVDDNTPPYACLRLLNCGYYIADIDNTYLNVPLSFHNGILDGKTINKLDKVTYTDKYGDLHNVSVTNHYELECYVDPCWLKVGSGNINQNPYLFTMDYEYEKLMLALQGSRYTLLKTYMVSISGVDYYTEPRLNNVHIKDVEKIETYSSYSTEKKVPTLKITLEVYI